MQDGCFGAFQIFLCCAVLLQWFYLGIYNVFCHPFDLKSLWIPKNKHFKINYDFYFWFMKRFAWFMISILRNNKLRKTILHRKSFI